MFPLLYTRQFNTKSEGNPESIIKLFYFMCSIMSSFYYNVIFLVMKSWFIKAVSVVGPCTPA